MCVNIAIVIGLVLFMIVILAMLMAPEGWEDSDGFHLGNRRR